MLNEKQQIQFITELVGKAIDTGKLKIEQPQLQPVVQEDKQLEIPTYEGGRVTVFDLLTCILFTLKLMGIIDVNWILVFVPMVVPHACFYGILGIVMLWAKIKNKKNKKQNG